MIVLKIVALVLHLSASTTAQGKLTSISDNNHLFYEVEIVRKTFLVVEVCGYFTSKIDK